VKDFLVRYALGLSALLILLGHGSRLYDLAPISRLDAIAYDTLIGTARQSAPDDRIVIVDIDEKSLAEIGRWPWGRDHLANLLDKLFDRYGVAMVGFDVVFAEPDDSSGLRNLEALARGELRNTPAYLSALRALRPQLDHDARFAAAIKNRPVVLGVYLSSRSAEGNSGVLPPPVLPAGSFGSHPVALTRWTSFGGNLPQFQQNAAGAGHINPIVDADGVLRRVPLLVEYAGQYYEALSLAMVRTLIGAQRVEPGYPNESMMQARRYSAMEWLDLPTNRGVVRVPVDEGAAALIPYRGPQGSFRYVSAADVLAERVEAEQLRGRMILVGTTAPALMDQRTTPVGVAYPGIEIHANLVAGMLDGKLKQQPAYLTGANFLLLAVSGAILVFLLPALSPWRALWLALAVLLALVVIELACWYLADLVLPLAGGPLMVAVLYALTTLWTYLVGSRSKRYLVEQFGPYVAPDLMDEMARNPDRYSMVASKAELTVCFADIRGFALMSENMPADQLAMLMNEYLDDMTAVIRRHRGTLDKYIGDAIMAFWGAPVEDSHHARRAVLCAMDMRKELEHLNARLAAKGWPVLQIEVGINTGTTVVGDLGSRARTAYTVVGEAVDLAARLGAAAKVYAVSIIVGERTRALLGKEIVFRELDCIRVEGKDEPVAIYEPLGPEGQIGKDRLDELRLWHQALRAYRAQDWDQAELALLNLSRLAPHPLYAAYSQRIGHCRRSPPGADWNGIWPFDSK
jgi:adenylate cyclase